MNYKLIVHFIFVDQDSSSSYEKEEYAFESEPDKAINTAESFYHDLEGQSCNSMASLEADLYDEGGNKIASFK